ncbi:hypothetical protein B7463_g7062, partial [Scytalidium lignicola]
MKLFKSRKFNNKEYSRFGCRDIYVYQDETIIVEMIYCNGIGHAGMKRFALETDCEYNRTSFAVVIAVGVDDDDLTLEDNLHAISKAARVIARSGKSETILLTADLQNGYEKLSEIIRAVIKPGVMRINLEDTDIINGEKKLVDIKEQVKRISTVLEIAKELGVLDFVVNARTDCVMHGGTIEEAY